MKFALFPALLVVIGCDVQDPGGGLQRLGHVQPGLGRGPAHSSGNLNILSRPSHLGGPAGALATAATIIPALSPQIFTAHTGLRRKDSRAGTVGLLL